MLKNALQKLFLVKQGTLKEDLDETSSLENYTKEIHSSYQQLVLPKKDLYVNSEKENGQDQDGNALTMIFQ